MELKTHFPANLCLADYKDWPLVIKAHLGVAKINEDELYLFGRWSDRWPDVIEVLSDRSIILTFGSGQYKVVCDLS